MRGAKILGLSPDQDLFVFFQFKVIELFAKNNREFNNF